MAGLLFIETKEYDSALFRFLKSADLFKQGNIKTRRGLALYNAANMLIEKNMPAKAIPYLDSAKTMLNLNDMQMKSSLPRLYCSAYLKLGNHALALDYAQQALKIAEENTLPKEKEVVLEYLSKIYEAKGDFKKSLDYHKQYSVMIDSIYDKDKNEQIASLKAQYENDKKEQQLSTQEATIALQQTKTNQLIIGIVSAVVLAIAVLIGFIQKSRSNKVLAKQKSEIELLLKEIHHRVKNNLQVISSLLSMQSRNMEEGDAKDAVREGQGRIKSMSLIHQKLYSEDNLSKINMKEYLEELSDFLFKSYKPGEQIVKSINAENLLIDVDTAVPLGLIVNELISNALKHAFTANAGGTLNVSLEKTTEEFVLRVSDTGKGLPAGFDQGKSMGMKLVRTLVQQIEGTLQIENTAGSHFLIRFRGVNVA